MSPIYYVKKYSGIMCVTMHQNKKLEDKNPKKMRNPWL